MKKSLFMLSILRVFVKLTKMNTKPTKTQNQQQQTGTEILPEWAGKLGVLLRFFARISPDLVAKIMAILWFKPFMPKPKQHVLDWQNKADQYASFAKGEVFVFGDKQLPLIICVHGWRGRAHQLRRFIEPLQAKGYRVGLVNLPGHHPKSENQTHIFECAEFIQAIWHEIGPIDGIVAHSFGSAVSVMSIDKQQYAPKKIAIIAANFDIQYLLDQYSIAFKLESLRKKIEEQIIKICDRRIFKNAWQQLTHKKIYDHLGQHSVHFWHDLEDKEVNIATNQEICNNLENAVEHQVEGVGHNNILRSPEVIAEVCDYLTS